MPGKSIDGPAYRAHTEHLPRRPALSTDDPRPVHDPDSPATDEYGRADVDPIPDSPGGGEHERTGVEPLPDSPGGGEQDRPDAAPLPDSPGGGQQQRPVPDGGPESPGGGYERGTDEGVGDDPSAP